MPATIRRVLDGSSPWSHLGLGPLVEENAGIRSRKSPEARRASFRTSWGQGRLPFLARAAAGVPA